MSNQQASDVRKKAELILGQCQGKAAQALYSYSSPSLNVPAVVADFAKGVQVEAIEQLLFYRINNEQVELLRTLYQACDEQEKKTLVELCGRYLVSPDCSAQAFVFLARYDSFHGALDLVTVNPDFFLHAAMTALVALAQILRFDHSFISNDDLERLCPRFIKILQNVRPKGTRERLGPRTVLRYSVEETKLLKSVEHIEKLIKYVCDQASRIQYLH